MDNYYIHYCEDFPEKIDIEISIASREQGKWILIINGKHMVQVKYCPFCGWKFTKN